MPRIEIRRHPSGVPFVKARTEKDLFHGLGMIHARERRLQMQTLRIFGEGRAAELFADVPVLFDYDVKLRSLGLAADARAQAAVLEPDLSGLLDAYVEGVNAVAFAGGRPRRTLEMRLIGVRPERWEPWHSLLALKVMAFVGLAEIQEDAERFVIEAVRRGVDADKLRELFSPYLANIDVDLIKSLGSARGVSENPAPAGMMAAAGSNAFAVAGTHSASGAALLANDPHLQCNRLPAIWMEAMAEFEGRRLVGSTLPGGPGFISARSPELAWGVTYSMADVIDFFVEEVKDDRVRRGDGWKPLEVRTERIGRRGKEPATIRVRESNRGIIEGSGDGRFLAMAWAGRSGTGAGAFRALHALVHATSVDQGMEIVRHTDIPPLNWVLADRAGNIGWQLGGRYPVRCEGWSGLHPVPGWDEEFAWRGFREPGGLPHVKNPASGVFVTANHNRNDPGQPPYISVPHPDCRAKRIEKILKPPGKIHLDMLRVAQLDVMSLQAERLLPRLLPHLPECAEATALRQWDHRYTPESREATLFENLRREVLLSVFGDRGLDRGWLTWLMDETSLDIFLFGHFDDVLAKGDSRWLPAAERDGIIRESALRAFARPWPAWGEVSRFSLDHVLLGKRLPAILGFDKGPFALAGSRATPRQGSLFHRYGRPVLVAPSFRFLCEVGPEVTADTCLPGGPAEARFSGRYATGVKDWLAGDYKKLSFDDDTAVELSID